MTGWAVVAIVAAVVAVLAAAAAVFAALSVYRQIAQERAARAAGTETQGHSRQRVERHLVHGRRQP